MEFKVVEMEIMDLPVEVHVKFYILSSKVKRSVQNASLHIHLEGLSSSTTYSYEATFIRHPVGLKLNGTFQTSCSKSGRYIQNLILC